MSRYDLTDFEWRVIGPLPPSKPEACRASMTGGWLNGIFWVPRSARR